jgi:hypothetical protein
VSALERDLQPHRAAFRSAPIPAVVIPGVISPAAARPIREAILSAAFTPFDLAPRGRYAFLDGARDAALEGALLAIAEPIVDRRLAVARSRWARLVHGDYALLRDDRDEEPSVELTLDISERASGGAEICYCHRGRLVFAAPQIPGSLTIVERGPAIRRYERYLSRRVGDAEIVRLRLVLHDAG